MCQRTCHQHVQQICGMSFAKMSVVWPVDAATDGVVRSSQRFWDRLSWMMAHRPKFQPQLCARGVACSFLLPLLSPAL